MLVFSKTVQNIQLLSNILQYTFLIFAWGEQFLVSHFQQLPMAVVIMFFVEKVNHVFFSTTVIMFFVNNYSEYC